MSTDTLERDAESLQHSLAKYDDNVLVSLSRETAEYIVQIIKAKAAGHEIIMTHGLDEVTPAEAALMLGVSRPQVRKLMEKGLVPFRKVGAHHRIPVAAIRAWEQAENKRREAALDRLAELQNELGLV